MNFMDLAIQQAKEAYEAGDHPIGAVLVIDRKLVGLDKNKFRSKSNFISHAEARLLRKYSDEVYQAYQQGKLIELYTSLEPCIMCLGTAVMSRVSRIFFACPDPHAGATSMSKQLTPWYEQIWPEIIGPIQPKKSYELVISYVRERHPDLNDPVRKEFEGIDSSIFLNES